MLKQLAEILNLEIVNDNPQNRHRKKLQNVLNKSIIKLLYNWSKKLIY